MSSYFYQGVEALDENVGVKTTRATQYIANLALDHI
jgi:hypothetical protein